MPAHQDLKINGERLLQPLVENAVGHGIRSIEEGVGRIRLTGRRDGDRLVLTVEDNGPGLGGVADGQGGSGGVGACAGMW